jgi:hypothetical protein
MVEVKILSVPIDVMYCVNAVIKKVESSILLLSFLIVQTFFLINI